MKSLALLKKPKTAYRLLIFRVQLFLLNKIIKSNNAWLLFDKAGIEGFGTNLIRLYFPIYYDKITVRESFSDEVKQRFSALIEEHCSRHVYLNEIAANLLPGLLKLPVTETDIKKPYLDNYYFGLYDAASLGAVMQYFKPGKIIEIGSGLSTWYMRLFKEQFSLPTIITCIDPYPRAEIDAVADEVIRQPLEKAIAHNLSGLQSGDIAFLDGSHYVYQGNDTLTFLFKFMPSLPSGVIIHIHDIYLPYDYEQVVTAQLWNEQYLVAAMLLAGFKGFEILHPAFYLSQTNPQVISNLAAINEELKNRDFNLRKDHSKGFSFWMRKL